MRPSRLRELFLLLLVLLQHMRETTTKGTPTHGSQQKCEAPDFIGGAHKTETRNQQLILTSFVFDCWAVITKWEAHIDMGHRPSNVVEFQVWRQPEQQSSYTLVGRNRYTRTTGRPRRRNKLTLEVHSPQQIGVQPGDIVGVYISTDGDYKIEFDGRRHDASISTYVATGTAHYELPLRSFNSTDLDGFQEVAGAPLIRVTVEPVEPSPVVPLPVQTTDETTRTSLTTLMSTYPGYTYSTTTVPSVQSTIITQTIIPKTPDVGKRDKQDVSLWQKHQSLFTSMAVCGFILVLLCIVLVIVLGLYIKARLKQRVVREHHVTAAGEENDVTANRQRHSSMFSLLPLDTARRSNLIAFKRRQTAPKVMTTSMADTERLELGTSEREYEDMYDFASSTKIIAKPQGSHSTAKDELQISMKENPSYTVLSEKQPKGNIETQSSLEQSENVYDVPIFANPTQALPPCREYEVPVSGSLETSDGYMTPHSHSEVMPCYENTMERSNIYTEIDI